jgi:Holliday junction resolvasome RuvABC ATP-dependent DNA helicase subunit
MIIEPAVLDAGKISGLVTVSKPKTFEFRPTTWAQFIGQEQAKARVPTIKAQFERGMRAHIILSAIRGHGKTSYIELLSKSLGTHLIQRIGHGITLDTLPEIINEINKTEQPSLLFIDEIDTMAKEMIKLMNPVIESFSISGKQVRPFLFACATINKYMLYKNNPDFLDRIQHHVQFTRYSIEELTQIITQVYQQLYKEEKITAEELTELARNAKFNPRTAINLLEYFVVDHNISNVLKTCCIVKDGLTDTDVKILEFLNSSLKPVGANAIALKVSMSQAEYVNEWESFLYEFGYLDRRPSRVITEKGKQFLQSIGGIK